MFGPAKDNEICPDHEGREVCVYCNDCKSPCCEICHKEKHQKHSVSTIEEKYQTAAKQLNDHITQLQTDTKGMLKDRRTHIKDTLQESDHQIGKANAFKRELKIAVDETLDDFIKEIEKPMAEAKSHLKQIEHQEEIVDSLINDCSDRIREGKLNMIRYSPPDPKSLIHTSHIPDLSCRHFIPNKGLLDIIRNQAGAIRCKERKISSKIISSFKSVVSATSFVIVDENHAWVTMSNKDIMYLYNTKGELVKSAMVTEDETINDAAMTSSGELIVTHYDTKVRCMGLKGEVSTLVDTTPFDALGVCLNDRGEMVVCMGGQGERNHVAVYSAHGHNKVREIKGQDSQDKQLISNPYRAVHNGENHVCVVNEGSNVVCVDEKDDVRWVYDGTETKLDRPFYPRGICKDKYHNLLVTDHWNHCVHYIDMEGNLIQVILTDEEIGLRSHWGIGVDDKTGQVWLGNTSLNVVIAKYEEH